MENIFDSHAHYNDERFDDDRDVLLPYLLSNGICGIINCGDDIESSKKSIELSKKYKNNSNTLAKIIIGLFYM